jgi:coenzyme F420-0:L-glutamate ligase/coenzyme F420-1:gamma-L-glutamate ligase
MKTVRLIGLRLPVVRPNDDLTKMIVRASKRSGGFRNGDILVVSSKAVATAEDRLVRLGEVRPSGMARDLAKRAGVSPRLAEIVLGEADEILGAGGGAILTLKNGVLCANAGVDLSNAPPGYAVLLPADPNASAERIRREVLKMTGKKVGVVISDSAVRPLRRGTIGQAVGFAGFEPVVDCRGDPDLFGRRMRLTFVALADLLASAAELLMGETAGRTPAVIVRGLRIAPSDRPGLSPTVRKDEDLYSPVLRL